MAGCGDLGTRLGLRLVDQGHRVIGLRRRVSELPDAFETISMDLSGIGAPGRGRADAPVHSDPRLDALDAVVITLTSDEPTRTGYERAYLHGLRGLARVLESRPGRVILVSSTRVLAEDPTRVITEDAPLAPGSGPGEVLAAAESEAAGALRPPHDRPPGWYLRTWPHPPHRLRATRPAVQPSAVDEPHPPRRPRSRPRALGTWLGTAAWSTLSIRFPPRWATSPPSSPAASACPSPAMPTTRSRAANGSTELASARSWANSATPPTGTASLRC